MARVAEFSLGWSEYPTHDWAVNIYFTGCEHNCAGCHNLILQDSNAGNLYSDDLLFETLNKKCKKSRTNKIVLLGGDPLFKKNLDTTKKILSNPKLEVCLYTGYEIDLVKEFLPNFGNLRYIKTGKFLKKQLQESKKTDDYLILSSPNQKMFKIINNSCINISDNGFVRLGA